MTLTHDARQSPTAGHPHSVAVTGIALVTAEIPLAVGASAVAWDSTLLIHQLVGTPRDLTARRHGHVRHRCHDRRRAAPRGFRVTEAVGMALAVPPVLLATLACWALDRSEQRRRYDEGPPPQLR